MIDILVYGKAQTRVISKSDKNSFNSRAPNVFDRFTTHFQQQQKINFYWFIQNIPKLIGKLKIENGEKYFYILYQLKVCYYDYPDLPYNRMSFSLKLFISDRKQKTHP